MLEKTKVLLIISLALCTVSCTQAKTTQSKTESPQASAPSSVTATLSNQTRNPLNGGDLSNIDKLLLQVKRANQASKDLASKALENGREEMEKDRKEGLHGGRSGLSKSFCDAALHYPTVEALTGCAEAVSLEQGNFEGKLKNFKSSSELYRTALVFSDRTNASLPVAERQKIEKNIACLDAFTKAPNPETPGCELVKVSLTNPNLPGGKIRPSPTGKQ